ncbi:MAG: S-layer homology domain-containing protein, partial [Firmicutes bacterium]|nr:S-layer homology domain-containing protein [Bacillota bacterium]
MVGTTAKRRKILSILVTAAFVFAMVFGSVPAAGANPTLSDVEGHWAQSTIQSMVDEGIVGGYPDGTFKPDDSITRAEFATLVVKAFTLESGAGKVFDDTADHWASDVISTANHHGLVSGYSDTSFGPDDPVTREQIAVVIVNATEVDSTEDSKQFTDSNQIADWAKESVDKATAVGLIAGYPDDTFKPKANATRAEAAVLLAKSIEVVKKEVLLTTYDEAGIYGPETGTQTLEGNVIINADGVILQNTVVQGNLIISEEVGDGDVTLNNVTVKGETFIRGGGKDSIHINGGQYNNIIVESTSEGSVRVVATDVEGLKIVISEKAAGEEIVLEGTFESVEIKADDIVFATQGETTIDEIKVHEDLAGVTLNIEKGTTVKELVLDSV